MCFCNLLVHLDSYFLDSIRAVQSLLAYPPASFVNMTFIGPASSPSSFIAFPIFLKSGLFACASIAALSLYLHNVSHTSKCESDEVMGTFLA
jgi:hypothetical protein